MRTIVHLSDLHFGRENPRLVEVMLGELADLAPSVVVVSGDLTQRARRSQFAAARAFLAHIPAPMLVVPGNHDIPLFDVLSRFLRPLANYKRYITKDLSPFYRDDELAVLGVNTARSNVWKGGRVSHAQIAGIRDRLCPVPDTVLKVLVTHHPFIPPPDEPSPDTVGRGRLALEAAEACGTDLALAGHLHVGYTGDVRSHHLSIRRSILTAQAGTAISTRLRHHPNGYNVIRADIPRLALEARAWDGTHFARVAERRYVRREGEWVPAEGAETGETKNEGWGERATPPLTGGG